MSDVKVAFLTDSCSDIPQELTDKYGIDVIGFHIMLDGKEYLERKDMTNDQFYEMMRQSKSVPTTAAITAGMGGYLCQICRRRYTGPCAPVHQRRWFQYIQ